MLKTRQKSNEELLEQNQVKNVLVIPWKEKAISSFLSFWVVRAQGRHASAIVLIRATAEYPCGGMAGMAWPFIVRW